MLVVGDFPRKQKCNDEYARAVVSNLHISSEILKLKTTND